MKKIKLLLLGLLYIAPMIGLSQNNDWCATDEKLQQAMANNPGLAEEIHRKSVAASNAGLMTNNRSQYTIPVVVHVIHDGGASNISYGQIINALNILNEDYNRNNPDAADTRSTSQAPFLGVAANVDIEFKLAKKDPQGNCTNGVVRVLAPALTENADDACKHSSNGGSDAWDVQEYLNIWVVNSIESSGGGTTLGYAYFPFSSNGDNYGTLIRNDAMGTTGTSNSDGRTLTHEVGHNLGLFHTFQSGCHSSDCSQNGDYVCDTPPVANSTFGCDNSQNTCNQIPANDSFGIDALDQYENYMSYDACQNMFSTGQKTRVHNILNDNQYNPYHLWQPNNLTNTGVNLPEVICKADFKVDKTLICSGQSISFTDLSYFGVTDWSWTFNGAAPDTSSNQNPTVVYNTPGVFEVSLEVSDGIDTTSTTKTALIEVLPASGAPTPYSEGFENTSTLPLNDWFTTSASNQSFWTITDDHASSGGQSLLLDNFAGAEGAKYELVSKTIDLSGPGPILLSFDYAYKQRQPSSNEYLRVYASTDCGDSWNVVENIPSSELSNEISATPYEPTEEEWKKVNVTTLTNAFYAVSDFRFKFEFRADNGNNFYLDNINILRSSVGVEENNQISSLSIYPNPNKGQFTLDINTSKQQKDAKILISDMSGREVYQKSLGKIQRGGQQLDINAQELPKGTYLLRYISNQTIEVRKISIQ